MTAKSKALKKLLGEDDLYFKIYDKFITNPKNPAAAEWDEWDNIHAQQKKNHPVAFFILHDCYYYLSGKHRRLKDAIWWIKYRTMKKHKYHLIDTKLEPGYYDLDTVLLHGCFSAFADFIENDMSVKNVKWQIKYYTEQLDEKNWQDWERKQSKKDKSRNLSHSKERLAQYIEMLRLYNWWKKERDLSYKKIEIVSDKHYANALSKIHNMKKSDPRYTKWIANHQAWLDIHKREDNLRELDTNNLASLVKLRGILWN